MTTATLQERVKCPRCGVRSIFPPVAGVWEVKDVDGHTVVIEQPRSVIVRCKCGSRYPLTA